MSPVYDLADIQGISFPRVSGDEPLALALDSVQSEFSPRERG